MGTLYDVSTCDAMVCVIGQVSSKGITHAIGLLMSYKFQLALLRPAGPQDRGTLSRDDVSERIELSCVMNAMG